MYSSLKSSKLMNKLNIQINSVLFVFESYILVRNWNIVKFAINVFNSNFCTVVLAVLPDF